jgi:predicted nucleotide-binding protein
LEQIKEAREWLARGPIHKDDFHSWDNTSSNYVELAFGQNHRNIQDFEGIGGYWNSTWTTAERSQYYAETLHSKVAALVGYAQQLRTQISINPTAGIPTEHNLSMKIFIVHGHNDALKYEIAHSLQKAGLDVTILHEEPNKGRTLLEKFSHHADEAGFAVILLTADDVGGVKGGAPDSLNLRARQNVVFELGFFIGLLGREKVCAVYQKGVELPSDLQGLVYIEHGSDGWKQKVGKEIYASGIAVDFAKL